MEEELVRVTGKKIPDCWSSVNDSEVLNIRSTKMRSILRG